MGESSHVIRAKRIESKHRNLAAVRRFSIDISFKVKSILAEFHDSGLLAFTVFALAFAGPIICVSWALAVWFSIQILRSVGLL